MTRQIWYPEFDLIENPFKYFETRLEEYVDVPYVETAMYAKVDGLLNSKTSCIIEGERGCGKTKIIEIMEGKDLIKVVTPRNVRDAYTQIFKRLPQESRFWVGDSLKPIIGEEKEIFDLENQRCTGCPARCKLSEFGTWPVEKIANTLSHARVPCILLEKEVPKLFEYAQVNNPFLLDCPDNLNNKELKKFIELCDPISAYGLTLIVFATNEQARMLKETDTFARFPVFSFEKPDRNFFIELYQRRITLTGRSEDEFSNPSPFNDEVLNMLIDLSGFNTRGFIELCNKVLVEMYVKKLKKPCDLQFLASLRLKPTITEREAFKRVLSPFRGEWIEIGHLAKELSSLLKVKITARKMGAMLNKYGFTLRKRNAETGKQVLITDQVELV